MFAPALLLGASLLTFGAPVSSSSESFSGADQLELTGFVGTVEIKKGRTLAVEVVGAPEGGPLEISREGERVFIEGDTAMVKKLYRRGSPYKQNWRSWNGDEAILKFGEFLEDYPVLIVTMPEGGDLSIDQAALILEGDQRFGEIDLNNLREVYGMLGDSKAAHIGIGGQGELSIGDVTGNLDIAIGGSGDVYAGDSGKASVKIGGSGDVELGEIGGALSIRIGGSGDVTSRDVDGSVSLKVGGSGDVEVGKVGGGIEVGISGSGDFQSSSVNGPLYVSINGSGDVDIDKGKTTKTEIKISGSGDVYFGGIANDPTVSIHGGGDVEIEDYTGKVSVSGDKDDVRIGDLTFENDRH